MLQPTETTSFYPYVAPNGRLHWQDIDVGSTAMTQANRAAVGAFVLSFLKDGSLKFRCPSYRFFHQIAQTFMQSVCAHAEFISSEIPLRVGQAKEWEFACPPIRGSEFADERFFETLWQETSEAFWQECADRPIRDFLAEHYPSWADAGRIYLHIAENKIGEGKPFTILLTYGVRDPEKVRLQHRPIGLALSDAGKTNDPKLVESLLRALSRASIASTEFARLQVERSIYRPFHLSTTEAFRLVGQFPAIEAAGILCKVPEYWEGKKPETVKVNVTFKTGRKQGKMSIDSMLGFKVGLALGDQKLTDEEIAQLLESKEQYQCLRGRWVEVNSAKIGKLLDRWQKASAFAAEGGLSFGEAMRWTSGLENPEAAVEGEALVSDTRDVISFRTDDDLTNLLKKLVSPDETELLDNQRIVEENVKAKLRPYQIKGVSWLVSIAKLGMGGCLADDMGLGKTLQIITLLTILKERQEETGPSLLIVPASLIGNWLSELEKFSPNLRALVVHTSVGRNDKESAPKGIKESDLVITTYGMVTRDSWMNSYTWNLIVADEAQAIKNPGTKQSKAVRSLKGGVRFALSGTPIENNLTDLWSIFDFAIPGLLGPKERFAQMVKEMTDFSPLRTIISPWLLRRKKSDPKVISDLPDKTEMKVYCYLTPQQAILYSKQVEQTVAAISAAEGIARKGLIFSMMMKLKQICNHPSQREGDGRYDPKDSGKFLQLKELCETIATRQEKVLVFTQFRELTDIIAHELEGIFKRPGLILHGAIPVDKRRKLVEQFQAENGPPFFVLSLKAGGTGLNLTAANHVIHFDRWWNPAVENQATDRAYRIGQKKNVLVHKFVCKGTMEDNIDALIESKKALAEDVVGSSGEINLSSLSDSELLDLIKFRGQSESGLQVMDLGDHD
jgi:superfamily II DNA or RNA helicase